MPPAGGSAGSSSSRPSPAKQRCHPNAQALIVTSTRPPKPAPSPRRSLSSSRPSGTSPLDPRRAWFDGTAQSRTINAGNQYTAVGGATPAYDNNGNMTTDETRKDYTYDAWNRLAKVDSTQVTYGHPAPGHGAATHRRPPATPHRPRSAT